MRAHLFRRAKAKPNAQRPAQIAPRFLKLPTLILQLSTVFFLSILRAQDETETEQRYEREELGVNKFTAPSIAQIFEQLDQVRPLPFDQLWRALPPAQPGKREEKAMMFGQLVADGFLIVENEKQSLIEELGRVLMREARGLGVADRVMKHSASLTDMGKRGDWPAVRKELVATQTDVEQAMIDLRDQKMAHLISLGGWLRGLEMSAGAVAAKFSPERAKNLSQPALLDYFEEELNTLPPQIAHEAVFEKIRAGVKQIRENFARELNLETVKKIYAQARELNLAVADGR